MSVFTRDNQDQVEEIYELGDELKIDGMLSWYGWYQTLQSGARDGRICERRYRWPLEPALKKVCERPGDQGALPAAPYNDRLHAEQPRRLAAGTSTYCGKTGDRLYRGES